MFPKVLILWSVLLFFGISYRSAAQVPEAEKAPSVHVETKSGHVLEGELMGENPDSLSLKVEGLGMLQISRDDIRKLEERGDVSWVSQRDVLSDPQSARYFFSANGLSLGKGQGYYQNTWVFLNQASYGISDNFTMGVGVLPLFLIGGAPTPVWITPKLSYPLKEDVFSVAGGGLFGTVIGEEGASFGIGYGAFTLGDEDHNLNLSLGYGMAGGEWGENINITVSGMTRLGPRFYLISENYFLPDAGISVLSFGGRSFFDRISLDYGLVFPVVEELFIGIPWLSLTIPFKTEAGTL